MKRLQELTEEDCNDFKVLSSGSSDDYIPENSMDFSLPPPPPPSPSLRPKKRRAAVQQKLQLSLENIGNLTKEIQYGYPHSPTNQLFSPDSSIYVGKDFVMLVNMQQEEVNPVTVESNDQEHGQSDRGNEVGKENKTRKRIKNIDKWKKHIRKMNRQSGKAYKSTANKEVPARTL
ncbi:uncharacterized protein LOC126299086 [Schistocerca gregaria]|uniref:uncharacterized protein LOC126299086 n=1 Tax=Schistocerca gregaria TaxID=7010 RepID=UPI00211E3A66|nr:uncharacterized protein LOC126299086 [Schistocerca gregaria]